MSTQPPEFNRPYPPPPPPPRRGSGVAVILTLLLLGSVGLNFVLVCCGLGFSGVAADSPIAPLTEKHLGGDANAADKIAVIKLDGAIMDGLLGYVHRQIDHAAKDNAVKGVVIRIDSPGGSITASDELHRRISQLRDGKLPRFNSNAKPVVVSMGGVCASGGYYVAMAATPGLKEKPTLFAERSTITGSIGVYASLLNVKEGADKLGVKMELVRAGEIKGSGSPFHELTPAERQPWQEMVDHAFEQFIDVVETGRPKLKGKLREPLFTRPIDRYDDKGNKVGPGGEYTRKRADGGIFTAQDALDYGLIDSIGTPQDAWAAAANLAGAADYKVVQFDKPFNLFAALTGIDAKAQSATRAVPQLDVSPRLWYLLPQAEIGTRMAGR